MGDPHHNTWGGKNNSWGNRNRKRQNNQPTYNYEPNKLFNTIAGGILLFFAGAAGLSIIGSIFTGVKDTIGIADKVNKITTAVTDTAGSSAGTQGTTNNYEGLFDIKDELELDADDIKDILQFMQENLQDSQPDTLTLSFEEVDTIEEYKEKIVNKLDKYSNFVLVYNGYLEYDPMVEKINSYTSELSNHSDLISDSGYKTIKTSARTNVPNNGNFILMLTFS